MKKLAFFTLALVLLPTVFGCGNKKTEESPAGYDFNNPVVYRLPLVLNEISGIAFKNGNADTIYAEQDEEGKLFYFHLGDNEVQRTKFSKRGDFEDVAIVNNYVVMLRSDGTLFTFPLNEIYNKETEKVNEQPILKAGEYESLYADAKRNEVYVLCKNCNSDKNDRSVAGQVFHLETDGRLTVTNSFSIDTKSIAALAGEKKINIKPSAFSRNPLTGEWYILSSVNKLLLITDAKWNTKSFFKLNPVLFTQPEGITFDQNGNLYISNEMGGGSSGTVLKFEYNKK